MSRERATVSCFKQIAAGEHAHYGTDISRGRRCVSLSFENPVAINFEIQEELARDDEKASEDATSNTVTVRFLPKKTDNKFKIYCEWAVICTVIVVIWGLLTLPTIYYHMPQVQYVIIHQGGMLWIYTKHEGRNVTARILSPPF